MEDNPPGSLGCTSQSNHGRLTARARTAVEEEVTGKCSGQRCKACSAGLLADCVALCCCPLAGISLLALAFVKVPYAMGKRCLGRRRNRRRDKGKKKVGVCSTSSADGAKGIDAVVELGEDASVEQRSLCRGFVELDNVLLELYQVGHLGFGRVSSTGIQPIPKTT